MVGSEFLNTDRAKVHLVKPAPYSLVGRVSPSYMALDASSRRLFHSASKWCSMGSKYRLASFSLQPNACPQRTDPKAERGWPWRRFASSSAIPLCTRNLASYWYVNPRFALSVSSTPGRICPARNHLERRELTLVR